MVVALKFDLPLSEWEVIKAGELIEITDMDYNGFTAVKYEDREFYCHSEYLEIPVLVESY